MTSRLKNIFKNLFNVDKGEFTKVILLTISFFLLIGAYTIAKELKDVVFISIVGLDRRYMAYAKILSMFILIPTILFHSRLVDKLRRHQLLYIYASFFAITGIIFAFLLGHPVIGLANKITSPFRIFGWLFYFFIEGYSPLVVSVFWAFANSITSPDAAKKNYTTMIAGSKLGGIITAGLACYLLNTNISNDVFNIQFLLFVSSLILLIVPFFIKRLVNKVPAKDLHGYEAAYQVEKERHAHHAQESWFKSMTTGLFLIFKYPYVMGIFGMSFFFELIYQAIKLEGIIFGKETSVTLSGFTSFLLWQALLVHLVGFFVVAFGTRKILEVLGEKFSLMLIPTLTGLSTIGFVLAPSYTTAIIAFVVTRSVNYAFAVPLRESLYIPTIKDIKFKTKSWIDGIGSKFAKTCGSSYNFYTEGLMGQTLAFVKSGFFAGVILSWVFTAYLLGKRYEKAVERNEVIGSDEFPH